MTNTQEQQETQQSGRVIIEGAEYSSIEEFESYQKELTKPVPNTGTNAGRNAPNLNGFVYVPATGIYTAKQRTCGGLTWYKTHEELAKQKPIVVQGLGEMEYCMTTIHQFREYLKYLKTKPSQVPEAEQILDDILTKRDPWRAEWLDADFKVVDDELYMNYDHRIANGELIPRETKRLELCLMSDKTPGINLDDWINGINVTSQGLPKPNFADGKLYYWCPDKDNNSVARFSAGSGWVGLGCGRDPSNSNASLGVFASLRSKRS